MKIYTLFSSCITDSNDFILRVVTEDFDVIIQELSDYEYIGQSDCFIETWENSKRVSVEYHNFYSDAQARGENPA